MTARPAPAPAPAPSPRPSEAAPAPGPCPARTVGSRVVFATTDPVRLVLQLAVAAPEQRREERLAVTLDGEPLAVTELAAPVGGRQHLVDVPRAGELVATYDAVVRPDGRTLAVTPVEQVEALRPSRYCPSDRLAGFAAGEFGVGGDREATVLAVAAWVARRLAYTPGSSGPTTDAVDTLLLGQGVCRDYAHLVAALCRAVDIPSRLVAVYAPGLSPMDLHAVVEVEVDGAWRVVDATRLAPRQSLVRVATGRDAADTAFATTLGGATLREFEVTAVVDGDLPADRHDGLAWLA